MITCSWFLDTLSLQLLGLLCEPLGSVVHNGNISMITIWMKSLIDGLSYYGDLSTSLASILLDKVFYYILALYCDNPIPQTLTSSPIHLCGNIQSDLYYPRFLRPNLSTPKLYEIQ